MESMLSLARFLIIIGVILLVLGGLLWLSIRLGLPLGNLPGDLRINRGNTSCVVALGTSILLSILLTVLLNLVVRWLNK